MPDSDLLILLSQIPQAERSSETGRALAKLIAERAAFEFNRSETAQDKIAEFNRTAFREQPGGQPRGQPFPVLPALQEGEEPNDMMTQLTALHRMSGMSPEQPEDPNQMPPLESLNNVE